MDFKDQVSGKGVAGRASSEGSQEAVFCPTEGCEKSLFLQRKDRAAPPAC
jgi:hypothetical protein